MVKTPAVTQPSETEQYKRAETLDFFRSTATNNPNASYKKAITSFLTFVNARNLSPLDEDVYAEWLINLLINDLSLKTAAHYLDIIAAVAAKAKDQGLLSDEIPAKLRTLKSELKTKGETLWKKPIDNDRLQTLLNLFKSANRQTGDMSVATDLLLLSLLLGGRNPFTIAKTLTKDELTVLEEEKTVGVRDLIGEIRRRHESPRRKYLFNFDQSRKTPRQVDIEVKRILSEFARSRNLPADTDLGRLPENLRILIALSASNLSASSVVKALGRVPEDLSILSLLAPLPDTDIADLDTPVAETLLDNPRRWFAMRLRPHVTMKELESRLETIKTETPLPDELFYPHEEIAKKVGKKLIFKQKPFINEVVFFRNRRTDILPLFSRIGDLAWCYTVSGRPGSPYAAISTAEFTRFQTTIGHFTRDIEPLPLGTLTPLPGEPVILLSGPFAGRQATVESVTEPKPNTNPGPDRDPSPNTILYRLTITADNGIEWRITAPARQISPAPKNS